MRSPANWIPVLAAAALATGSLGIDCSGSKGKKIGQSCAENGECESNTCWENRCAAWGAACDPSTLASKATCDDKDPCTADECAAVGKCFYTAVENCGGSAKSCQCGDAGSYLEPDAGCSSWADRNECSAWHSVVMGGGGTLVAPFPDGTKYCMAGCCITLRCD